MIINQQLCDGTKKYKQRVSKNYLTLAIFENKNKKTGFEFV